jgi:hypothetical protein
MSQPLPLLRERRAESGSAYIVALLVLVVLTVLGLALALITQTEMQTGATEVTLQRAFYAADSGVSRSMARTFTHFDCTPILGTDFKVADQDLTALTLTSGLREEVAVTAALPLINPPCPLCSVNNAGGSEEKGKQDYYEIHHVESSQATRLKGTDTQPLARRDIGVFFALQPWPKVKDCYDFVGSPEAAKVKM